METSSSPAGGSDDELRRRWPRRVYGVGKEPDPRFTFANERTFLAWIRTSLALLAAGVAVDMFADDVHTVLRRSIALVLVAVGISCGAAAYLRWMASERALRLGRPLPPPRLAPVVAGAVVVVGLLAAVLLLARG